MTGRTLITGARGYLGGRLVRQLSDAARPVAGTSRSEHPPPPGWPSMVPFSPLDPFGPPEAVAAALEGVETIVHLAAANEVDSARSPEDAIRDTGLGTRRLLDAAVAAGVRRFIFLSTIHVYGSPLEGRLDESALPRPIHPYAISHRLAEDFVLAAHQQGAIEGVIVRLSNAVGAPAWTEVDRWTLVGNDLARQVVEDGRIVLKTPGLQWREFITLPDFCAGVTALIDADAAALGDGVFNLGGDLMLRVIDIAERVAEAARVTGRPASIIRPESDEPPGPPAFQFPLDRIRRCGFTPTADRWLAAEIEHTLRLLAARSD